MYIYTGGSNATQCGLQRQRAPPLHFYNFLCAGFCSTAPPFSSFYLRFYTIDDIDSKSMELNACTGRTRATCPQEQTLSDAPSGLVEQSRPMVPETQASCAMITLEITVAREVHTVVAPCEKAKERLGHTASRERAYSFKSLATSRKVIAITAVTRKNVQIQWNR